MPMPSYPVYCYTHGCKELATYKVASRWSDGMTSELKTYALCCSRCLPEWWTQSRNKQAACRLAPGETLDAPAILRRQRSLRGVQLERDEDLEKQLASQ